LKYMAFHNGAGTVLFRGQIRAPAAPSPRRWTDNADAANFYADLMPVAGPAPEVGGSGACAIVYSKLYATMKVTCVHTCTSPNAAHIHGPIADTAAIGSDSSNLWFTFVLDPATPGIVSGTATGVTAGEYAQFINARYYVNVHTAAQGPGCARGQIYRAGVSGPTQNLAGPSHIAVLDQLQAGFGPTTTDLAYSAGRMGVALVWNNVPAATLMTKQAWTGLSTAALQAHIHGPAAPSSWFGTLAPNTGNVVWTIAQGSATTVSTTNSFTAVTAAQTSSFDNGNYYFNVHTTANGGGEIRGQVVKSRCYPYTGMACPAFVAPAGSSSSSTGSSSTAQGGSASTIAVSGLFFTLVALLVAMLQ
jgi:hypothetical protein